MCCYVVLCSGMCVVMIVWFICDVIVSVLLSVLRCFCMLCRLMLWCVLVCECLVLKL